MIIATSPDCNAAAEAISDATGCAWMCCDRQRLEDGRVSEYTCKALGYTGCNPNVHSVLVLKADGEKKTADFVYHFIEKTRKPTRYLDVTAAGYGTVQEGTALIKDFMATAAAQRREPRPISGLTITIQNAGSDFTTAIFGNPVVGRMMELLTKDGGITLHGAVEGLLCGLEGILPEKFAKREDVLKMMELTEHEHEVTLKETGLPFARIEPSWVNIPEGITTAIEKGYQILRYYDNIPIQGILDYCEQPPHSGAWITTFENVLPPTSALYGSLQGAHMHIITTSAGYLYYEIPHMVGIRSTGNEETFNTPEFKKDFNAGAALRESVAKTGEKLYQLVLDAAEGKVETNTEKNKQKVFHMWYRVPITPYNSKESKDIVHLPFTHGVDAAEGRYGKGFSLPPNFSKDYAQAVKMFTDYAK
jgi:altronate dehydratase